MLLKHGGKLSHNDYGPFSSYSYYENDEHYYPNFSIEIYVNEETEKVSNISLTHKIWDY